MEPTTMWIVLAIASGAVIALVLLLVNKSSELNQVRGGAATRDREMVDLRNELRGIKDEHTKLRDSVTEYKDKLHHTKKKSHNMHEEFETIRRGWDKDKEALQAREEELRHLHSELTALREESRELRAKAEIAPKLAAPRPEPEKRVEKTYEKSVSDNSARLQQLEKDHETLRRDLNKALAERTELRRTVNSFEKRLDDYRRADLIARNKLELAEDKLTDMGKRYYNAVSELALLKGQVAPLPPKAERNPPSTHDKAGDELASTPASAPGDATPTNQA